MGKNFDVELLVRGRPLAKERAAAAAGLLSATAPWIGEPRSVSVHDVNSDAFLEEPWPEGERHLSRDLPGALLVYVHTLATRANRGGAVGVEQGAQLTSFRIAIPMEVIAAIAIERLEGSLWEFYGVLASRWETVLLAGPEFSRDEESTDLREAVAAELTATSLITHVIGRREMMPAEPQSFMVVSVAGTALMLRHQFAEVRLRAT
ncbi:MAG TPA: hypothetical protein VJU87_00090 [Gemmatimonadaceae bacterium]|nr:hypothetical protein [Gemmatimonadaceae bacterium]